jgi:hypothetical protein
MPQKTNSTIRSLFSISMIFLMSFTLLTQNARANVDIGSENEVARRLARWEHDPKSSMGSIEILFKNGYQKTAVNLANLYFDSGIKDEHLVGFLKANDRSDLTDR